MREFSFRRMWQCMQYEFSINNNFSLKNLWPIAVLPFIVTVNMLRLADADGEALAGIYQEELEQIGSLGVILVIVGFAGMFMNCFALLRERPSRLKDLMMPASNAERFLGHMAISVCYMFGTMLVALLGMEVIHAILAFFLVGPDMIQSWPVFSYVLDGWISWQVLSLITLSSFIMLFQSLWYKRGIWLGFAVATLLTAIITIPWIAWEGLLHFRDIAAREAHYQQVKLVISILCTIVLLGSLWLSYHNYCRAQIVDRRNK